MNLILLLHEVLSIVVLAQSLIFLLFFVLLHLLLLLNLDLPLAHVVLFDPIIEGSFVFLIFLFYFLPGLILLFAVALSHRQVHFVLPKHFVPVLLVCEEVVVLRCLQFNGLLEGNRLVPVERDFVLGNNIRDFSFCSLPLFMPFLLKFSVDVQICGLSLDSGFFSLPLRCHIKLKVSEVMAESLRLFHHAILKVGKTPIYSKLGSRIGLVNQSYVIIFLLI